MMNRITQTMHTLRKNGDKAFIPFITAGYPDMDSTISYFHALERAGADIIELGMPFSDPLADGPTIQSSSDAAIRSGATPAYVFDCIRTIRRSSETPVILFAYSNLIVSYGIDRFLDTYRDCGGDGLLVPDLPVDEAKPFKDAAKQAGISMIFLVSPLTSAKRMKRIERYSDDFVYCVSVAGVTGARAGLFSHIEKYLRTVRETLGKPFVVGFGVSSGEDARKIAELSDGVVVGSAILKLIHGETGADPAVIEKFARDIHNGIEAARRTE